MADIPHTLKDKQVAALKLCGLVYLTVTATKNQVSPLGTVQGAFKSRADARRFATVLNKTYGSGLYEATSI